MPRLTQLKAEKAYSYLTGIMTQNPGLKPSPRNSPIPRQPLMLLLTINNQLILRALGLQDLGPGLHNGELAVGIDPLDVLRHATKRGLDLFRDADYALDELALEL